MARCLLVLLSAGGFLTSQPCAYATEVLDQNWTGTVDGQSWPPDHLSISVWSTNNGVPLAPLGTVIFPPTIFSDPFDPIWGNADFSFADVQVLAGKELAIVLSSLGSRHYSWYASANGPFFERGATMIQYTGRSDWIPQPPEMRWSMLFREFVVPEPQTLTLLVIGLFGASLPRRRRRMNLL